jgi:CMP-N-acetylneuraminic acid synthetase
MKASRILAVVPARGGSKGIPGKNVRPLGGLPLLGWTLNVARDSGVIDRLVVSTDDARVAAIAAELGAPVPWMRPPELATDASPTIDAVLHVLDRLAADGYVPDAVLLLQPTSPFRSVASIRAAAALYAHEGAESLVSVSPVSKHPWHCVFVEGGRLRPVVPDAPRITRRQDLPPAYAPDGSIYLTSVARLRGTREFLHSDTIAYLTPSGEGLDLDTPEDWAAAERIAEGRRRGDRAAPGRI